MGKFLYRKIRSKDFGFPPFILQTFHNTRIIPIPTETIISLFLRYCLPLSHTSLGQPLRLHPYKGNNSPHFFGLINFNPRILGVGKAAGREKSAKEVGE